MIAPIRRRAFLGMLSAAGAVPALPAVATTVDARELVLVDARFTESDLVNVSGVRRGNGILIGHADVLQWRRELLGFLEQGGSIKAYTHWDLALLLSDLGREARRQLRCDPAGKPVMITLVGPTRLY